MGVASLEQQQRRLAMEAILHAVSGLPEAASVWLLRGGLLSQWWCLPYLRPADDVDFLATYPFDAERTDRLIDALAGVARVAPTEVIWEETASPGLRYQLSPLGAPEQVVQVDVGFGDPTEPPPLWWDYPSLRPPAPRLQVIRPELGLAWKLHGLFEQPDRRWRPKDLHDLWLFLRHAPLEERLLPGAIRLAFESRQTPLWRADRLLAGEIGQSRASQRRWERLQQARPEVPSLRAAAEDVAQRLAPLLEALHPPLPDTAAADANTDDAFPSLHHLDEILPAIAGDPVFRLYDRGEFLIVNAEQYGEETFPEPSPACSPRIRRYRLLRRECRGLVFDAQGHLLARRYHKFFAVGEREQTRLEVLLASESAPPLVLEKLDGALLCPVRLPGGLRLLSRRGISPLSLAAEDFAAASSGHRALWAALLEAGQTPLLEWCHRDHRLVVDHPAPRLVLTGVRERTSGRYLAHEAVVALGASFGVEVVRDRGHATDLRALVHQIEAEEEGEGVVLRWPSGRLCKLKTLRYRRLHRATEAHQRTRAQWEVLFHGEGALLCALLPPEEAAAFRDLEARVHAEVRQRAAALADRAHTHRHSGGTVQDLGLAARSLRGPERAALFAAWAGQDPEVALWSALRRGAESSRGLAELRQWFMPEKTGG